MSDDRRKILVEHGEFNWGEIDGATLKDAGEYLLKLAKVLPADTIIDEHWTGYEDMEIRAISYRDETDEEYALRKKQEAESARLAEAQRKRDEAFIKKRAEYHRLKRELGL